MRRCCECVLWLPSILLLTAAAAFDTAKADRYPWCAEYTGGALGGSGSCYFMTIAQCCATVSGVGGYCAPNAFYSGPPVMRIDGA